MAGAERKTRTPHSDVGKKNQDLCTGHCLVICLLPLEFVQVLTGLNDVFGALSMGFSPPAR